MESYLYGMAPIILFSQFFKKLQIALTQICRRRITGVETQKMRRFKGDDLFGVLIGGFELEKHLAPFNDGETPGHIPVKGFKIAPEPDSETVAHLFCRRHKLRQFAELHMTVHKGGVGVGIFFGNECLNGTGKTATVHTPCALASENMITCCKCE